MGIGWHYGLLCLLLYFQRIYNEYDCLRQEKPLFY